MSRRTTLKHTVVAALAVGAVVAAPAGARPLDRIDRFDNPTPTPAPYQDLRGEHATDPAPPGSDTFMPGQPTWPTHPVPIVTPAVQPAQPAPASGGGDSDDTVWLIVGIGLAASGIVAGSAAGVAHRVRARRVAV
jgi:hypothetical protein